MTDPEDWFDKWTHIFDEPISPDALDSIPDKIKELIELSRTDQKSDEWLQARHKYITGSAVAAACGIKGPAARKNLLLEKVSFGEMRTFFGSPATEWGERFEPVANEIYTYRNNCKVYEFGLIPHSVHGFLAASTDGVTEDLINLEIKCPISRDINGKIPKHYWHQVQHQLEVLDLDLSHFLECRFFVYDNLEAFLEDFEYPRDHPEKGILIEKSDGNLYSPVKYCQDQESLLNWRNQQIEQLSGTEYREYYWVMEQYSCQNVPRDPDWFKTMKPIMDEFWTEVEKYRELGLDQLLIDLEANQEPKKPRVKKMSPKLDTCML